MTITEINNSIKTAIADAASETFGIEELNIAVEVPPKTELGDAAFPVAFELAKAVKQATGEKQNPRAIAEDLSKRVSALQFIDRVEIAGPGYLNVFYDRGAFFRSNLGSDPTPRAVDRSDTAAPKVCVEHTSVNPNKAAHIGHVRNSVLGDTFQRILTASGKRVEIQNYIDNTGVQVADVVVGFLYLENLDLDGITALDERLRSEGISFDYYCWDLYAKVGRQYETDEALKAKRAEILHLVEEGGNATAELADYVATRNVECILDTMERIDIRYDLLPRESEILHLHFWDTAFEQMKQLGVIEYVEDGKQAGCWVMPFEDHQGSGDHENDKILVRSNGTVTYTGKDIAYQMWKLGILGLDFNYRLFHKYADGREVWMTTADQVSASNSHPSFGGGESIYNVIDTRQSYTQGVVKKGVAAISPERGEKASIHLAYEMVALSPVAAEELGFVLSEDDKKRSFIEMSGRKGLGVKADDLIDRLEANALIEVGSRHQDISDEEKSSIAHDIAIGALRYFLLKFTRNTVIVFDFKEALSFEGETGCFCQYAAVRANSIFRKIADAGETIDSILEKSSTSDRISELLADEKNTDVWAILTNAMRLDETIEQAANAAEPAILAKYAFNLAKSFNLYYHNHKMVNETNADLRAVLIAVTATVHRSLTTALGILGIKVPAKM